MFIENAVLKIDVGCDNESCDSINSLEFNTSADDKWPQPTELEVLAIVAETWFIVDGLIFCSKKCHDTCKSPTGK